MELFSGTVNVREQTELNARARADSDENAEKMRNTTAGWIRVTQAALTLKVGVGQFFPGAKTEEAKQQIKLLDAVKLSVEDRDLVVTMKADTDLVIPFFLGMSR